MSTTQVMTLAITKLDGRAVAVSGDAAGTLVRWDLATLDPLGAPMTGHAEWIRAIAVTSLGKKPQIVSGSGDSIRIWDLESGAPDGAPIKCKCRALTVAAVQEVPCILAMSLSNHLEVWELKKRKPFFDPDAAWPATRAFLHHDETVLSVVGRQETDTFDLEVWDLLEGEQLGELMEGEHPPQVRPRVPLAVADLGGDLVLLSGAGTDGVLRLWDVEASKLKAQLKGHTGAITDVALADLDGGPAAVSASEDGTLRVWNLTSGKPLGRMLTGHEGAVNAVAVGALDGRPVAISGGADGTLRLWDLTAGKALASASVPGGATKAARRKR